MRSVHKIVVDRMAEKEMTKYALAKATGITNQTIGKFVAGDHDMRSDKLALVLDALGLEIRPKGQK